ncbi:hypothetical protein D5086_019435 [Populus alba]|uniref:Uncharacterized protein n=1 Tax=Populus alba TaxID=43335 RepID=A0ACC4BHY1_POPAL
MPSTTSVLSTYTTFAASATLPPVFLSTRITPSVGQLKVSKDPGDRSLSVTINKGQQVIDTFEGMELAWEFACTETQQTVVDVESWSQSSGKTEHRSILLCFHKNNKEKVLNTFLPYVLERSKAIKNEKKVLKLQSLGNSRGVNLHHPSTFDTLAMDPVLKKEIMDDLGRFVKRKDFYLKVGKPWKRGRLLYGPPGRGKSSLIEAMANYLKFDIYDLELASLHGNSDLRKLLTRTTNRSILVIEDIDCSIELQDRQNGGYNQGLIGFLERKKVMKRKHPDVEKQKEVDENQKENENKNESLVMEEKCEKKKAEPSRRKRARKPKGRT